MFTSEISLATPATLPSAHPLAFRRCKFPGCDLPRRLDTTLCNPRGITPARAAPAKSAPDCIVRGKSVYRSNRVEQNDSTIPVQLPAKRDEADKSKNQISQTVNADNVLQIKIYPTITSSGSSINILSNLEIENLSISIKDISGKEMMAQTIGTIFSQSPYSISLNTLSAGLYFVQLYYLHNLSTYKLIIQ